ncbi:MAG: hypothetical protein EBV05_13755, partial [Cyanobacteria bacterium WB6_1B_304]|nr:hypothetical protein [Cyanobacteria bacterium WB6_1B_304]
GSLSKITALKQDIKRWIGVRHELMNGTLSQGQMLSKLMEELIDVKDVIEELSQETSPDEQGDRPKDDGTTDHVVEKFTDTPISKVRRNPIRKCRESVNIAHTNDINGITDEKLISALNILWNEGFYHPDITYVKDYHYVDPIAAFMALKVNVRDDTNPTVKKAMESVNKEGWIAAMQLEWRSMTWRGVRQGPTLGKRILPNHNPRQPQQQVIRTTWQLLQKLDRDGNHVKFKARCCASGDMLRGVIQKTFSPTVKAITCVLVRSYIQITLRIKPHCT